MKFNHKFTSRIRRNSLLSLSDQALTLMLGFFISILLARYLGAVQLGQYSLALSMVGIVMIICDFGTGSIMSREIAKKPNQINLYLGNTLGIKIWISFPLMLALVTILNWHFDFSNETKNIIYLVAVYSTLLSILRLIGGAYTSLHRSDLLLKLNFIIKSISLAGAFVLLYFGCNLFQVLFFFILVAGLTFLASMNTIKSFVSGFKIQFDFRFNKVFILTSLPLALGSTAEFINLKIDNIFLALFIDNHAVGIYAAAFNIFIALTLVPLALSKVYFPNFVDLYKTDKLGAFFLFRKYNFYFILYSILASVLLGISASFIILTLYGETFKEASAVLSLLAVALPAIVLNRHLKYTLVAMKQNWYFVKITIIGSGINVLLNIFMIQKFGIIGAVVATALTEYVMMSFGYVKMFRLRSTI